MFKKVLSCLMLSGVLLNFGACGKRSEKIEKTDPDRYVTDQFMNHDLADDGHIMEGAVTDDCVTDGYVTDGYANDGDIHEAPTSGTSTDQQQEDESASPSEEYNSMLPSTALPMSTFELVAFQASPLNAMYRSLINNYQRVSEDWFDQTVQFAIADWNQDGRLDLLLNTSRLVLVIYYRNYEEKDLAMYYYYTSTIMEKQGLIECPFLSAVVPVYWYPFNEETIDFMFPKASLEPFSALRFSDYDSFLKVCYQITECHNFYKLESNEIQGMSDLLYDCPTKEDVAFFQ